jgi:hypothetical protein
MRTPNFCLLVCFFMFCSFHHFHSKEVTSNTETTTSGGNGLEGNKPGGSGSTSAPLSGMWTLALVGLGFGAKAIYDKRKLATHR